MNEDNRRKLWTLIQEAGLYYQDFFPKSTTWRVNGESMKLLLFMISYLLCQNLVRK